VGGFDVIDTFRFVDSRQANDAGIGVGTRDALGLDVTPVGSQPVTAQDGTTVTASRSGVSFKVPYLFSPVLPDQFFASVTGTLQTAAWTLSLSNPTVNGGTAATIQTPQLMTTTPVPFVLSVNLVANGLTPTVRWTIPAGDPATKQSVYIFDRSVVTPDGNPLVYTSGSFSSSQTSFTVPTGVLVANHKYTFSVQEDQRSNGALIARSRSFVNFEQDNSLPPGTVLQLPVVTVTGSSPVYNFNFPVGPGQIYYLDPAVATGYLYQIGTGDPLFASVELPSLGAGISYTLCLLTAGVYACDTPLAPDETYDFQGGGAGSFEVMLDGASFDPQGGLPFVTALTFEGSGSFTGSITPLISNVPEPASAALFGLGLSGLGFLLRRRRESQRRSAAS
jgi:hypothetical protein